MSLPAPDHPQPLPQLALGLGCDRGTPLATVQTCIAQALALIGAELAQVCVMATIAAKADEVAFIALAAQHRWPVRHYSAAQLAAVPVPNPSATVLRYMGTPSVSEAAALLAAGTDLHDLLVEKHKFRGPDGKNATVSVARYPCSLFWEREATSHGFPPRVAVLVRGGCCIPRFSHI